MRTELPDDLLRRRLGARPGDESADESADNPSGEDQAAADDPNSLVPRWLPDGTADDGWLAKVRADPGRTGAVGLAAIAAVAVLVTVFTVVRDRPEPVLAAKLPAVEMVSSDSPDGSAGPVASGQPNADQPVVVSVVGLVHQPGLVTLTPGARVADALSAAGGALAGADTAGLNMARTLADGEQIVVGLATPAGRPAAFGSSVTGGPPGADAPRAPATAVDSPGAGRAGPVNLNTASAAELDTLPGVGPVMAAAIVAWRTEHGRFTSVDQLAQIDGIGPARLEKLRPLVRI